MARAHDLRESAEDLLVGVVVVALAALALGGSLVAHGVELSDDSFVYIDRALHFHRELSLEHLRPLWFPPAYGAALAIGLGLESSPVGAASWLNAVLLMVVGVATLGALRDVTGRPAVALLLTLTLLLSPAVTWPFRFAWSEGLFMSLSAVHLWALARYVGGRGGGALAALLTTGVLLLWTRYAGIVVVVPLGALAWWDLRRHPRGRAARAAAYLVAAAFLAVVPLWNPGRFLDPQPGMPFTWRASATGLAALLSGTRDAVGSAVLVALVAVLAALAVQGLRSRSRGRAGHARVAAVPATSPTWRVPVGPGAVLSYVLLWLLAYALVLGVQLARLKVPGAPPDPFLELRLAAPAAVWIIAGVGAGLALLPRRVPGLVVVGCAAAILLAGMVEGRRHTLTLLGASGPAFAWQYGYWRDHQAEARGVEAFLREAARLQEPLTVAVSARARDGMPPRSYVRSVLMAPGAATGSGREGTGLALAAVPEGTPWAYEIRLLGAAGAGPRIRYVEETSDLSTEALLRVIEGVEGGPPGRWILLTGAVRSRPWDAFVPLGYRIEAAHTAGGLVLVRFVRDG